MSFDIFDGSSETESVADDARHEIVSESGHSAIVMGNCGYEGAGAGRCEFSEKHEISEGGCADLLLPATTGEEWSKKLDFHVQEGQGDLEEGDETRICAVGDKVLFSGGVEVRVAHVTGFTGKLIDARFLDGRRIAFSQ